MDPSINRPGTQVTTVTKEKGDATDERPHYVRVRESAPLSEGQFPNKPHLTEHAFLFLLGTRSPSANPRLFSAEWAIRGVVEVRSKTLK